jgi:catabolite repression HPr-like protein
MITKNVKVNIKSGLDARPVALLVQAASQYESKIYVESGSKKFNAKSIMGMMTLGLSEGDEITIQADGTDEETAMTDIEKFLSGQN